MPSFRKSADLVLTAVLSAPLGLARAGLHSRRCQQWRRSAPAIRTRWEQAAFLLLNRAKFSHVGVMQYAQSLPLADKEVVLTFDDGPLPPHSIAVLDILASQCVKATFFLVGEMAREFPAIVRRIHEEGHTIGTHTEHHPGAHAKNADRKSSRRDRSRHRRRRRGAVGSKRSRALLPHSRLGAQRCDRAGAGRAFAGGVQLRHGRRRLASRESDRRTSFAWPSAGSRRAARAFCCFTTFIT